MTAIKEVILFFLPMVTGTISLITSSIIAYKIMSSDTKLKSPYSRLIFGLSCHDIISSFANLLSSMPIPPQPTFYSDRVPWGSIGNGATCRLQGLLFTITCVTSPCYNLALCIYFFCVIRYSMTDRVFQKRLEPWLHVVPIGYSVILSMILLMGDYVYPHDTVCWIGTDDESKVHFLQVFATVTVAGPIATIFLGIIVFMTLITFTVIRQEKRMDQYRFGLGILPSTPTRSTRRWLMRSNNITNNSNTNSAPATPTSFSLPPLSTTPSNDIEEGRAEEEKEEETSIVTNNPSSNGGSTTVTTTSNASTTTLRMRRRNSASRNRIRAAQVQANLFFAAFLLTFLSTFIYRIMTGFLITPPYAIAFLSQALYPLQGFFNVFAHTHPQIASIRRLNPNLSYLNALIKALWEYDRGLDRRASRQASSRWGNSPPMNSRRSTAFRRGRKRARQGESATSWSAESATTMATPDVVSSDGGEEWLFTPRATRRSSRHISIISE